MHPSSSATPAIEHAGAGSARAPGKWHWLVLAAGGSCLAASLAFWAVGPGRHAASGGDRAQHAEIQGLQQRLQQLEAAQVQQRGISAGLARANTAAGPQPEASDPSPEEAAPAVPPPTTRERYDDLEAKFSKESIDRSWAATTEAQLTQVVHQFAKTKLLGVSCRSTMCRVEVEFPNLDAREEFDMEHVSIPPFVNTHIWTQRFPQADGSFRSVEIVSRQGPLPILTANWDSDAER
jgi:hypothetical protein